MRTENLLKCLLFISVVLTGGLLSVQGSLALWNKTAMVDEKDLGTVRAADFVVSLQGSPSGVSVPNIAGAGEPTLVPLADGAQLSSMYPGQAVYAAVTVGNETQSSNDFTVLATLDSPRISGAAAGGDDVKAHLVVNAAHGSPGQCATAAHYRSIFVGSAVQASPGTLPPAVLPKGTSAAICFEIILSPRAPQTLQGSRFTVDVPISVEQSIGG